MPDSENFEQIHLWKKLYVGLEFIYLFIFWYKTWVLNSGKREAQKQESIKIFLTQLSFHISAFQFSAQKQESIKILSRLYQRCIRFFFFFLINLFLFKAYLAHLYSYPTCTRDVSDTVTLPILSYPWLHYFVKRAYWTTCRLSPLLAANSPAANSLLVQHLAWVLSFFFFYTTI